MSESPRLPDLSMGAGLVAILLLLGAFCAAPETGAQARATQVPMFNVDPLWPKPLPNHWVLGSVTGVAVDSQDHIWITHRGADSLGNNEKGAILNPPTGCCVPAPQVLEFDQAGNLLSHWGGPGQGFDWPQSTGGITVDHKGNVWIAAAGQREPAAGARPAGAPTAGGARPPAAPKPQDAHVIKFSRTGQFLLQIGHAGKVEGSDSKTGLNRPAAVRVDAATNEVYVADGHDKKVFVLRRDTLEVVTSFGDGGRLPGQFYGVGSIAVDSKGNVYTGETYEGKRVQKFVYKGMAANK